MCPNHQFCHTEPSWISRIAEHPAARLPRCRSMLWQRWQHRRCRRGSEPFQGCSPRVWWPRRGLEWMNLSWYRRHFLMRSWKWQGNMILSENENDMDGWGFLLVDTEMLSHRGIFIFSKMWALRGMPVTISHRFCSSAESTSCKFQYYFPISELSCSTVF